ncbi:MAG: Gfo/Idh/MocA family oxidoreductase [Coxiellaceae bacterium]|nr:Gfo/Idh/MocA family oxidoreductase [Coxiellaceae bacterium]
MTANLKEKKLRWGILGTSFISEVMSKAIQSSETGELIAISSRSIASAKAFSEKFSIPQFYGDAQSLLNNPDIDAIYIGLPNYLHKEWIIRSAQLGKHVLCEKPLVLNTQEANEVRSVIEGTNILCMEALMYRYHPFIKKLKALVDSKLIGEIQLYTATYTANISRVANPIAGGAILSLGCYPVSLVRLLANAEPIEIRGVGRINENTNDNQASVILKFPNHSMATISTADDIEMRWQFDLHGTEGHIKIVTNPWLPSENNKIIIQKNCDENPFEMNIGADKPLYTYQIDSMSNIINKNHSFLNHDEVSLADSMANTAVLEAWLSQVKS